MISITSASANASIERDTWAKFELFDFFNGALPLTYEKIPFLPAPQYGQGQDLIAGE